MVLLAAFTGLRLGELRALRRSKLDLARTKVQVVEQTQELADGTLLVGEPKSDAGRRIVTFPQAIVADMEAHLALWAAPGRDGLVFCGTKGQPMRRATFYKAWARAVRAVDVDPHLRLHDLRVRHEAPCTGRDERTRRRSVAADRLKLRAA
jgi:integrase